MGKHRKTFRTFLLLIFLAVIAAAGIAVYFYKEVIRETATRIERGVIDRVIASESPVYYDDGLTPIGVFFEETHRSYMDYDQIPKNFVKALIASEDGNFFRHRGFDFRAISRAFMANFRAGRVVQGGSTLTQQTAKNVFKREKRSYEAKLKELIQAFLLERKYSKEEILEMYANQFFVTGYGKGLQIAAQYFFDKEAKHIDLVEAAFIAGSVKGPNRYNPFIKKNETEQKEARRLAKLRKDYVLSNMLKHHFITESQYQVARNREVPFKEGRITYRLNVILDYVREQLESDFFSSLLKEQGIENVATSGIRIFTSVNKDIQEAALKSLRSHLPVLDVKLKGFQVKPINKRYQDLVTGGMKKTSTSIPFLARVTHIQAIGKNPHLAVSWDDGGGVIDYEGLRPMGEAWLKWKLGNWAVFGKKHVHSFLKNIQIGDLLPVQIMALPNESDESKSGTRLRLSQIPELEGGITVIRKGKLKAMVGGFFNRFFNRSVDAKRQLGSIFKPMVYAAALQLKWNTLDTLQNIQDVYQFETTSYIPRPDHQPKSDQVSVVWAGAKSENLATVWLLYHLTDRLNLSEFRQITEWVGLARKETETYLQYKERIRDRFGVIVDKDALMEAAFEVSKNEVESDLIFAGYEAMLDTIRRLHFNLDPRGFDQNKPEQRSILRRSFKRLQESNLKMKRQFQNVNRLIMQERQNQNVDSSKALSQTLHHFYRTAETEKPYKLIYTEYPEFFPDLVLLPLSKEWVLENETVFSQEKIRIDGLVASGILDLIQGHVQKNYKQLLNQKRYDLEVLSKVRDFRVLVNLLYVVRFSKELGIVTDLEPVLSFPLGPNSISILEAALAYHAVMTGQVYPIAPGENLRHVPIISKIVDRDGETLWEYRPNPMKVLSERVSGLITEILRNVMEIGTGKKAKEKIMVSLGEDDDKIAVSVPSFGKTGTSNRFTNSSFVGFIPAPNDKTGQLGVGEGYVIASYVGYDDNRSMKGKHFAIYGASGALPLWIDAANAIVNLSHYKQRIQPADLAFGVSPTQLQEHDNFINVSVSPVSGLPLKVDEEGKAPSGLWEVLAEIEERGEERILVRRFEPMGQLVSSP